MDLRDRWKRIMMVLGEQEPRDNITALNQNDANYEECTGSLTDSLKGPLILNLNIYFYESLGMIPVFINI